LSEITLRISPARASPSTSCFFSFRGDSEKNAVSEHEKKAERKIQPPNKKPAVESSIDYELIRLAILISFILGNSLDKRIRHTDNAFEKTPVAQVLKNSHFTVAHAFALGFLNVIVAMQMQKAVNQQKNDF